MRSITIIYAGLIFMAKRFSLALPQSNVEDTLEPIKLPDDLFSKTCLIPDLTSFEKSAQCPSDPVICQSFQFFSQDKAIAKTQELSKKVNISIAPHLVKFLEEKGLNKYHESLQKQAAMVIKLLPNIISPKLLAPILSDPSFSIEITDNTYQPGVSGRPEAVYLPWPNKILLIADSDWTDREMQRTLRDEFHHVVVRYQNMQLNHQKRTPREAPLPMIYPFLRENANFKPNKKLIAQHKAALKNGFDRLLLLKNLVKDPKAAKDPLLLQFQQIILNYDPEIYREEIDKKDITADEIARVKKDIKEKNGQEFSKNPDGFPYYVRWLYDYKDSIILKYVYNKDDSWQEKAKAFFIDMAASQKSILGHAYSTRNSFEKDMELSSFLQEFPEPILRFVFPEWCQYFDDYHQLDDGEYCADISRVGGLH